MATGLYAKGREAFLKGSISWNSHNIKVALIDAGDYTVNLATHDFLDDVAGAAIVATSSNLASKTTTDGVADAADVTFTAVTGDPCEALIIYRDSGSAATSELIAYIDNYAGLPITPNGQDINLFWPNDSNKIFKL